MCARQSLFVAIAFSLATALPLAAEPLQFNRDIRPILSENCFFCHGPDANRREAGLRLDDVDAARDAAIVPGDPDASELIARIVSQDPDSVMPPPETGKQLTSQQVATLRRWIEEGAVYQSHWSWLAPVKPSVPLDQSGWARNEIDQFILAKMQTVGLRPAPECDRATWMRRVAFDLTGLPPSLDDLDRFLRDSSPTAYETVVDQLLASPRFGERMTADWLDVSRYSDSYGMQVDRDRRVWPYRDWVIQAFNRGLSYDQFITEQLAGDLLPQATQDQILATAFNRLHPQECEGGSVPEEFRMESVADRTQTVATAFLGLTMECARCHDHKYDPLTQRDYYSLSSFFDNIDEAGLYSYFTDSCPTPTLELPTQEQRLALQSQARAVQDRLTEWQQELASCRTRFTTWAAQLRSQPLDAALEPLLKQEFENFESKVASVVPGKRGNGILLNGDDGLEMGVGNFHRGQPFTVGLWLKCSDSKDRAVVFHRSRAWTDAASRGYELLIEQGHLQASLIHFWPGNAVSIRSEQPLALNEWIHVAMTWDGSSNASGLTLYVNGEPAATQTVRDALTKEITGGGGDELMIGARFRDRGFTNGIVDDFVVYDRELSALEVRWLYRPESQREDLQADWTEEQVERWFKYFTKRVDPAAMKALQALQDARQKYFAMQEGIPEIMVMREMAMRRPSFVLARGAYDAPAEPVTPNTPASLLPFDPQWPRNRLGLAKWLTSPQHPLTSRVAVNRWWQLMFGRGFVNTPEDFGSQGSLPSHPELLDWLAVDFQERGWDLKRFLRELVLSATYRQSSLPVDPRDTENRYWSRAPRYRMSAEMLRDNVLAISGLLDSGIGGEPAKPYEVEVSFKPVPRDQGRGLHRRSIYTYWKRTGPAPMLTTLDASLRDVCRVKRDATASPLQSLVMFNSPQFIEASRVLAEQLIRQHQGEATTMVEALFRMLTSRHPSADEVSLLVGLYERQAKRFAAAPDKAEQLLAIGDVPRNADMETTSVAATTSLIISLLGFDQAITKR